MSCASHDFDPVQDPRERRQEGEENEESGKGRPGLDRGDRQGADDTDPDKGGDPKDPRTHHHREPAPPRLDDLHERHQRRRRADPRGCGIGGIGRRLAVIGGARFVRPRRPLVDRDNDVVAALLGLRPHEPPIGAVAADQLGVASCFDDAAMVEDENAVGADDAGEPVRQHNRRAPVREPVEPALDQRFVLGIDRRQRLVEDQNRRIAQQCPGDRQALALPARQIDPALAKDRLIAERKLQDEIVRVGIPAPLVRAHPRSPRACRAADCLRPCRGTDRCPDAPRRSCGATRRGRARGHPGRRPAPPRIADRRAAGSAGQSRICRRPRVRRCRSSRPPRP